MVRNRPPSKPKSGPGLELRVGCDKLRGRSGLQNRGSGVGRPRRIYLTYLYGQGARGRPTFTHAMGRDRVLLGDAMLRNGHGVGGLRMLGVSIE